MILIDLIVILMLPVELVEIVEKLLVVSVVHQLVLRLNGGWFFGSTAAGGDSCGGFGVISETEPSFVPIAQQTISECSCIGSSAALPSNKQCNQETNPRVHIFTATFFTANFLPPLFVLMIIQ